MQPHFWKLYKSVNFSRIIMCGCIILVPYSRHLAVITVWSSDLYSYFHLWKLYKSVNFSRIIMCGCIILVAQMQNNNALTKAIVTQML